MADEELNVNISNFIENKRRHILIGLVSFALICAGFVVTMLVLEAGNKKAIKILDETFIPQYKTLIGEGELSEEDSGKFINDVKEFARKHSGYAAAKAFSLAADVYYKKSDWKEAREAYLQAALKAGKNYLAPVSYFNAAASAEKDKNIDAAIEDYTKAFSYPDFSQAAHAQFSAGRLYEAVKKIDLAKEAYQNIIDKWPKDTNWTSAAHSRLIYLEINSEG
jgi:tetratricopeptide (TPR) repeat protein